MLAEWFMPPPSLLLQHDTRSVCFLSPSRGDWRPKRSCSETPQGAASSTATDLSSASSSTFCATRPTSGCQRTFEKSTVYVWKLSTIVCRNWPHTLSCLGSQGISFRPGQGTREAVTGQVDSSRQSVCLRFTCRASPLRNLDT